MRMVIRGVGLALITIWMMAAVSPANATAVAGPIRNTAVVFPWFGIVDGILVSPQGIAIKLDSYTSTTTKTVSGNASMDFSDEISGLRGMIRGTAIASSNGHAVGTHTLSLTYSFTNESGQDFDSVWFQTDYSAFNPGGPEIGAKVDNTTLEFARFTSSQSGEGIGDFHTCDTRDPGSANGTNDASCGVGSPDSSTGEFGFNDFDNGETFTMNYTLALTLEVSSVPEPATLSMFIAGLLVLGRLKRVESKLTV